jgi:hypothetical protein
MLGPEKGHTTIFSVKDLNNTYMPAQVFTPGALELLPGAGSTIRAIGNVANVPSAFRTHKTILLVGNAVCERSLVQYYIEPAASARMMLFYATECMQYLV